MHSDAGKNERLKNILEQYADAIYQGAYEERLYETFLHNISKFNYLLPVDKAIKKLNEQVDNKREEITLTKLLEEMKDDHVSFIYVDLIQEDVARYVKEPNAINRVQLRNALMPYASDPYINEMFNIIYADNTKRANELSEKALNIKDQINIIRENATISNIYTPVQYINENVCVFNVNGLFYIKKGNNISKLDEKYVNQLDDKFIELCQLVNDPNIEINEDNIVLTHGDKYAVIYEGYVDIFGNKESKESLRNLREMCMKYDDYDTNFYIMCSCLLENFNNIAKIDWAKHVTLNENNNISADLFKLNEHLFLTLHDDSLSKHTLYCNINPIFCKNKLNEHMGINISSLFSDLLPSQDKIILKLNETKNAYEDAIEKYEDMIEKLKDALKDSSDENKEKLNDAIDDAKEKLNDIKSEYKDWQKEADKVTGKEDDEDDENTIREKPNEPIDDDEVDDAKDELSTPLDIKGEYDSEDNEESEDNEAEDEFDSDSDSDENYNEEDSEEISDEEFDDYLNDEESEESEDKYEFDSEDEDETEDDEYELNSEEDDEESEDEENSEDDEIDYDNLDIDSDEDEDSLFNDSEDEEPEDSIDLTYDEEPEDVNEEPEEIEDEDIYDETSDEEEGTDAFGGDVKDPMNYNKEYMEEPENTPQTEDEEQGYQPDFSYKIADVMFDENVKEGIKEKSGSVIVIVPMIDGTGKKYVENKTIEFYLNDQDQPILDNEPMTNELYAAVIDAIKSHPDYQTICETAEPANEEGSTIAALNQSADNDSWEEEYLRDGNDEDREEYYKKSDDMLNTFDDEIEDNEIPEEDDEDIFGFKDSDFDDEEDTNDVVIPTYKSGNTEIELPASNVDNTRIPESLNHKHKKSLKEGIKITPVFKKPKSNKRFF